MGEILVFVPPHEVHRRLARAPRIPRAPLAWGTASQTLAAIGASLIVLGVLIACWLPFLALGWLVYRRLH